MRQIKRHSAPPPRPTRRGICAECGQPFSWVGGGTGKYTRKYCQPCRYKIAKAKAVETRPRIYTPCEVCGEPVYTPPSARANGRRFCSKRCYGVSRRGVANPRPQSQMPTIYRGGVRPDLGHYCRSSWEANFARVLRHRGISYRYEPSVFILRRTDGTETSYRPDFETADCFYEVKGRLNARDAEKIALFREQCAELPLVVIDTPAYHDLRRLHAADIPGWEAQHLSPETLKPPMCECGNPCKSVRGRFCSRECSNARYRKPAVDLRCGHCGTPFSVQPHRVGRATYCSKVCANAAMKRAPLAA